MGSPGQDIHLLFIAPADATLLCHWNDVVVRRRTSRHWDWDMTNLLALQPGTELVADYRIERVLGAGGFGITYLATETALDRLVTIKEYFPSDYAARGSENEAGPKSENCKGDYQWGLDRFIAEAQTLAKFNHPNIVRVYRYFTVNSTAYMVLHFEEGQSLKGWLKSLGRAPRQRELDELIAPLLDALEIVHRADFLHRDIAPDNIIIRKDGSPVLIDFGAARGEIAAHSKTVSALVKPGYSPYEQYAETSRQQGPWTDIYALGATLYHAVTGKRPPDAPSRMVNDELVSAREAALAGYRQSFLTAIDKSLTLQVEGRPQSVVQWRGALLAPDPPKPSWLTRARERRAEGQGKASAATVKLAQAGAGVPPPPDAPGAQGGLLDFIDGLKKPAGPAEQAAPAEPQPAPANPATAKAPEPGAEPAAKVDISAPAKKRKKVETAPRKARAPRPRPVKPAGGSVRWRGLLVKLLIGAGVAAVAVGLQDKLPQVETRGSGSLTSQRTPVKSAAATKQGAPVTTASITQQKLLRAHRGPAMFVAFSNDGMQIISGGQDATVKVWNAASGSLLRTIEVDNGPLTALAVSGRRALTGHGEGTVALWDIDRGEKLGAFRRSEASIWSLAFLGDGSRFAAGMNDDDVAIWETRSSVEPAFMLEGHDGAAQALAVNPQTQQQLVSGSADRTLKLWNTRDQNLVRTYRGHRDLVTAVTFAPDGKIIASGALDGGIRLWSSSSSRVHRTLSGHKGRVTGLAFSPAGDLLASTGEDGTVRLWDFRRGRIARIMSGHAGIVRAIAYAPDGRSVVSAGEDGTLRLWDAILPRPAQERE